jgi:type VI protein secretion system component Hcp
MAIPVHLFLTDDGGAMIHGSSDVQGREGSMELWALHHSLSLPLRLYVRERCSHTRQGLTLFSPQGRSGLR